MTPKELLDTILGYLGFVVQIDETQSEGGNPKLQIYMEESHTLIGPDGATLAGGSAAAGGVARTGVDGGLGPPVTCAGGTAPTGVELVVDPLGS